jgi:hypothetical protein
MYPHDGRVVSNFTVQALRNEPLSGYSSPQASIPRPSRHLRRRGGRSAHCHAWFWRVTSPKYAGLLEYGGSYGGAYLLRRGLFMPWELPELLDGELVRADWRELQTLLCLGETIQGINPAPLKVTALETVWYMRHQLLRDTDWASMAHSLEARVPLVDIALLRTVTPMLAGNHPPAILRAGQDETFENLW